MVIRVGHRRKRPQGVNKVGHWGAWRALAALPAMVSGFGVVLVALGFLGRLEGLAVLAWLGAGLLTLTRRGERVAVRLGCGFRRPSREQGLMLEPLWSRVIDRCGISSGSVDLYLQRSRAVNSYSVGSRSVAVTGGIVSNFQAGKIEMRVVEAVLAHELGHRCTNGSRFIPVTLWLAMPWRLFSRAVLRLSVRLTGRQPMCLLAIVVVVGLGLAMVQAGYHGAWGVVMVLGALGVFGLGTPVADAALSRGSERAADRFAAEAGYGDDLARALMLLDVRPTRRRRLLDRTVDSHPDSQRRIDDLRHSGASADRRSARLAMPVSY